MSDELVAIAQDLRREVRDLEFGHPVAHIYRPLDYAWDAHRAYLERFGGKPKEVVFVGMNPGPWGMAQTGIPFGEINAVRDWLGISAAVDRPENEHPKRPVTGLDCPRSEVSGRRVWAWAQEVFGTPEAFFARFFVANYCPLLFLEASGRNLTPDRIPARQRAPLLDLSDESLRKTAGALQPDRVIGFGTFAETSARRALEGTGIEVARVLHPSPASPAANRGWAPQATAQLRSIGVAIP